MEDGLGDTSRVSLTEDPEFEIPVCKDLVKRYENRNHHSPIKDLIHNISGKLHVKSSQRSTVNGQRSRFPYNPFEYKRRHTHEVNNIGGLLVPVAVADFMQKEKINAEDLKEIGYNYDAATDKWNIGDSAADYIYTADKLLNFNLPGTLKIICAAKT